MERIDEKSLWPFNGSGVQLVVSKPEPFVWYGIVISFNCSCQRGMEILDCDIVVAAMLLSCSRPFSCCLSSRCCERESGRAKKGVCETGIAGACDDARAF